MPSARPLNVRNDHNSGHSLARPACPPCARSGHRNAKAAITDTGLLSIREIIEHYE
jgi:hypothetical protein